MITIIRIRYKIYTRYTLYRSFLPIYGIAIVRLPSFLFFHDFEGNTHISVAIKSGSTVFIQSVEMVHWTCASMLPVNIVSQSALDRSVQWDACSIRR